MAKASATMVGREAPGLELPGTDGETHRVPAEGEASASVVVWTCNHCPYALAWHERIVEVAREYADRGVHVLAINSNDAERYPLDSFEAMRERVAAESWPFPYLHDESQEAARAWNAQVTPHLYVIDPSGVIRYEGAADADHMNPGENAIWLREALDAVLAGEQPGRSETDPVGCSIKWRE